MWTDLIKTKVPARAAMAKKVRFVFRGIQRASKFVKRLSHAKRQAGGHPSPFLSGTAITALLSRIV